MTDVINQAGGQSAGSIELLMDPSYAMLSAAQDRAMIAFKGPYGYAFPAFQYGLSKARIKAQKAHWHRDEMPVIDEADLPALKDMLRNDGYLELCEACTVTPSEAKPSQCQIYVDKCIDSTAEYGVAASMKFLTTEHLILSKDGFIVDGHHRWLSAYMTDPGLTMPAFRAPANLADIWSEVLAFSDARHRRNA